MMAEKKELENKAKEILIRTGLMYDKSRLIGGDTVVKRVGGLKETGFHKIPRFGIRAWKVVGKKKTLIVWDCGNDWYQIVGEVKNGALQKETKVQRR